MLVDVTDEIVAAAQFGVAHHGTGFFYSEGANRLDWRHQPPFTLPWYGDCFVFCQWCYIMGDAPPPVPGDIIFTGTAIEYGTPIPASVLKAADVVIYFDNPQFTGDGVHAALVVNDSGKTTVNKSNPLTISMGHQGAPEYTRVKDDGRPYKFYKYITTKTVPDPPPVGAPQKPLPVTWTTKIPNAILHRGMVGWQVRWLQTALGQKTNFPYWFGKTTQAKLGHFQRTNGLHVTGVTNAETWKALGA